jgi:dTDP-4-dehydrorhamnose 3,5-epimerase
MKFTEIIPDGPWVIEPQILSDHRGEFFRYYCEDLFGAHLPNFNGFKQYNQSINYKKGTLRGMHYQGSPYAEDKLVRCISGAIWDVCIDLRKGSVNFLSWYAVELSSTNKKALYIPKGFAHGFITLEDDTEIIYHHSEVYTPAADAGLLYNEPRVGIQWPLVPQVISEKDKNFAYLNENFEGIEI